MPTNLGNDEIWCFSPMDLKKSCWCCCFWSCWWSQPWKWSNMIFQPNGPSTSGCREGGCGPRPLQQVFQRPLWGPSPSCSSWWWRVGWWEWTKMAMTMIMTRVMYTNQVQQQYSDLSVMFLLNLLSMISGPFLPDSLQKFHQFSYPRV